MVLIFCSFSSILKSDIVFCDQLPNPILLLRIISYFWWGKSPFFGFYCHYPDYSDPYKGGGLLKYIYKDVFNRIERLGMSLADVVYTNSTFTKNAILGYYPNFPHHKVRVLYPGTPNAGAINESNFAKDPILSILKGSVILSSINRITPFKKIERVIKLVSEMKKHYANFITVIAGGLDDVNDKYFISLQDLCSSYSIPYIVVEGPKFPSHPKKILPQTGILFLLNATNDQKSLLLKHSKAIFYSSSNEHFGIGVCEAMLSHCLAISMGSGGPLEIIEHMKSGYLIPESGAHDDFSPPISLLEILARLFASGPEKNNSPHDIQRIIQNGYAKISEYFTMDNFTTTIIRDACNSK
ncbi:hypothetical protein MDAP_001712 [Mitosporidium daphniae]